MRYPGGEGKLIKEIGGLIAAYYRLGRQLRYSIITARTRGELLILSPSVPNLFDRVAVKRKYGGARRDIFAE